MKKGNKFEGAKDYRDINKNIRKNMEMAKETWIESQCRKVDACHIKNESKTKYPYHTETSISTTIKDKSGKCIN